MAKRKTKVVSPVEYEITIEPDDADYHGNCSAIDEDTDRENEKWITDELARGNELAWCWVGVKATFEGYSGYDSLGGCSYKNMRSLERDLIPEMKENALAALKEVVQGIVDHAVNNAQMRENEARAALKVLAGVKS